MLSFRHKKRASKNVADTTFKMIAIVKVKQKKQKKKKKDLGRKNRESATKCKEKIKPDEVLDNGHTNQVT